MCAHCDRRERRRRRILRLLQTGMITSAELAKSLRVTPRTIYREIDALRRDGHRILGEAGVGYLLKQVRHG